MTDWRNEKVLVTGGSGFLGANLVHVLVQERNVPAARIRSFADRPSHALDDLPEVEQRFGDILDPAAVVDACAGRTIVFHAAASTTFDPRLRRPQWLVNVEGTRNVLEAVRASRSVRRLCHTSTVNVLGCPSPPGSLGTEGTDPYASRPRLHSFLSPSEALDFADAVRAGRAGRGWWKRLRIGYYDSKLTAQELVNRAARDGLEVVSVLPGTSFGPYEEFGGSSRFLFAVLQGRIPGVPPGGLPLAHVRDVARGHALAMEKGRPGVLYIVSGWSEDNRRFSDMMRIIAEVVREKRPDLPLRSRFPVVPFAVAWAAGALAEAWAALAGRPAVISRGVALASRQASFYSSERARRELCYRPERFFRDGVSEMYDYLVRQGGLP